MTDKNFQHRYVHAISAFMDDASPKLRSGESMLESRHIDELNIKLPSSAKEQVALTLQLYQVLLNKSQKHAEDLMAMLVIGTEESESIGSQSLADLLNGKLKLHYAPPELYLISRAESRVLPYMVEEYKLPIQQDLVTAPSGCVYAYFRAMRNDATDTYHNGFYFEHYPYGEAEHNWA